jgi:hypothetical protein
MWLTKKPVALIRPISIAGWRIWMVMPTLFLS